MNIKNRNSSANLGLVLELYERLLNVQKEVERLRAERNVVANKMKGKLEPAERQKLIEEGSYNIMTSCNTFLGCCNLL